MATWRDIIESYPCPTCEAPVGHPCVTTTSGRKTDVPHAARATEGARCTSCTARLAHGWDGPLCGRCQLIRDLEVERATKYRRRDP